MQRANISMALVCMIENQTCLASLESSSQQLTKASNLEKRKYEDKIIEQYPNLQYNITLFNRTECKNEGFNWSKTIQGTILSLVFFGMLLTQVQIYFQFIW
jgi:hypothetical protein